MMVNKQYTAFYFHFLFSAIEQHIFMKCYNLQPYQTSYFNKLEIISNAM